MGDIWKAYLTDKKYDEFIKHIWKAYSTDKKYAEFTKHIVTVIRKEFE